MPFNSAGGGSLWLLAVVEIHTTYCELPGDRLGVRR